MSGYYQNQSHQQETAPTEYLHQNFGFSPAYEQQPQRVPPPYPSNDEYQRQPATAPSAPYPTLPPLHQHQQPHSFPAPHITVQPAAVRVEQPPPRIVYVQQRQNSNWCVKLCCECVCAIVSSVLYTALGIITVIVLIGLVVYFSKFYKH